MAEAAQPDGSPGALLELERSARQRAEQSAERMQRLAAVATALSSALTARDVVAVIVDEAKTAIGAFSGGVWVVDEARATLDMMAARGMVEGLDKYVARYPIDTDNPLCASVRQAQEIWVETWDEFARR